MTNEDTSATAVWTAKGAAVKDAITQAHEDATRLTAENAQLRAKLEEHVPHILAETYNAAIRERDAAREALRTLLDVVQEKLIGGVPPDSTIGVAFVRRQMDKLRAAPESGEPAKAIDDDDGTCGHCGRPYAEECSHER